MDKNETTRLKLKVGAVRLEYDGREEFLKSEVLTLVKAIDRLQISSIVIPFDTLQRAIEDSLKVQLVIDDTIAKAKVDLGAMNEMSEDDMQRLQRMMDQLSQLEMMISNLMKAASDTAAGIMSNLKSS